MSDNYGFSNKLFWPLTLIFCGVLVMMLNLGVIPESAWKLWPAVPVVIGLIGLSSPMESGRSTSRKSSKKR